MRPIAGARVLVTRAREDQAALAELLRLRGAQPVALPCIELAPPSDRAPLDAALARLARGDLPDLVIVASPHAAQRLFPELRARGIAADKLSFGAVGDGTAGALRSLGAAIVLAPSPSQGAGSDALVGLLVPRAAGMRVLLPRAEDGNPDLPARLRALGAEVEAVPLYRTITAAYAEPSAAAELRAGRVAAIAFASGSAAQGFATLFSPEAVSLAARCAVACMGERCSEAAEAAGMRVDAVGDGGLDALVDAVEAALVGIKSGKVGKVRRS